MAGMPNYCVEGRTQDGGKLLKVVHGEKDLGILESVLKKNGFVRRESTGKYVPQSGEYVYWDMHSGQPA
jgi:hypothetical protein